MEKVLVTGVTGFIGSNLAKELVGRGYKVYGFERFVTGRDHRVEEEFLKGVEILTCDIDDYHSVSGAMKKVDPDLVFHLASLSPVRESFERPFPYIDTHVVGTANIAYSMLELPNSERRRLIYASTAEVYGFQEITPTKESAALNPSSPYATVKAACDMYIRMMSRVYGLNAAVIRCTNSYGRKLDASFFIEYLVVTMLKGDRVYIGAPDSLRDYMYVTDHVNAYLKAMEGKKVSGEAFNASTGEMRSNKDTAYKIADMIGFGRKGITLGKYPSGYPSRPIESDQTAISLDSSKIARVFGWKPTVSLDDGLKKTIKYWSERIKS
ncbi:MAG: NAD-dependent epimerase/dehydratase family protein [Candidatus Micrarchaeaceae archaeon]